VIILLAVQAVPTINHHMFAGEHVMTTETQASPAVPRELTRGYANSWLDTRAKPYVPAVDQPALTVADLDALDQHHGR
jgi:hypothetical protein